MPPMSLPEDLVYAARRDREQQALTPIVSNIDGLIRQGMGGLEAVAKGAAEQVAPVMQLLSGGELKLPTLDDLTPEWMRPKPVQAATMAPAQTPATLVDGRQQVQPRMQPGEQMGNVEISQGPAPQAPRPLAPVGNGQYGEIDNSSRESFVRTAWPYMLDAAGGDKNLAELMLAKAISENGDVGKGGGFIGNNFSGIKGEGSAGSFEADTWEDYGNGRVNIRDRFAAYHTPQEGFRAFMAFLHNNERYAPALARYQQTGDASQLFRDIRAAGYATDPIWADKIENIRANQVAPVVRGASGDMQRLSLNTASPVSPPGGADTSAGAGVASPPAPASTPPAAPWANETNAGGGLMMKADGTEDFLPGDGGTAPQTYEQPYDPDQGPREATPGSVGSQPLPQTPNPMTYGPIQQGDVAEGPPTLGDVSYQNGGEPTGNGQYIEMPVRPLEAQQPEAPRFEEASAAPSIGQRITDALTPIYNAAGTIVGYMQGGSDGAAARAQQQRAPQAIQTAYNSVLDQDTRPRYGPENPDARTGIVGAAMDAGSNTVRAAIDAATAPSSLSNALPMLRGANIVMDAINEFGEAAGRQVAASLGWSDEDFASVAGIGISPMDVAGAVGSMVLDPTNLISGEAPAVARGVRRGVQQVAEGAPAVARRAGEVAQGVGRGAYGLAEEAAYQATFGPRSMAQNIVPPGVARQIPTPSAFVPDDVLTRAVEATPSASLTPDGLVIDVSRFQTPEQAGQATLPRGVFYTPGDLANNLYRHHDGYGMGGAQGIQGQTVLRNPLPVQSIAGGDIALDALQGRGAGAAMQRDLEQALAAPGWTGGDPPPPGSAERLAAVLRKYGVDDADAAAERLVANLPTAATVQVRAGELIVGDVARKAGHDSIVEVGPNGIREVFDLREATYPTPDGGYTLRPEFQPPADGGPDIGRALASGADDAMPTQLPRNPDAATRSGIAEFGPNNPIRTTQSREPWQMTPDEWRAEMARVSPDGSMPDPQVDNAAYRRWYELNANKPVSETPALQSGPFETDSRLRPAIESSYLRPDDYRFVGRIDVTPRTTLQAENTYRAQAGLQAGGVPHAKFERDGRMTFQGEILTNPRAGRTMTHEVGHSIENNLPESLLERWTAEIHPDTKDPFEYGRHLQNGGEAPPTPYAGQNWKEDFAETFTEWRQAQAEGRAPNLGPLRQRFMQDMDAWLSGGRSLERGTMDGQRFEQPRLLSTVAASPGGAGRDIWARIATDIGNSLAGGMAGAVYSEATGDRENLGRNVVAGMVGAPILGRGMRRAGGAMGTMGVGPNGRPSKPTVEVLQQELDGMRSLIQRARASGDAALEKRAIDRAWQLESELVDARNARLDLEPRIASDVGRRIEDLPLDARSADDFAGLGRERVSPDAAADLTQPSAVATDMRGRMNSALPFDPASAAMGGAAGAMSEGEDGEQGDPLRTAAGILLAGVGGGMSPGARARLQRAMQQAERLKAAGRADEAAQVVQRAIDATPGYEPRLSREPVLPGMEPPRRVPGDAGPSVSDAPNLPGNRMGNVPPSQLREPTFPGMEGPYSRPNIPDVSETPNRGPVLGDVPPSAVNQSALPGMDPVRDAAPLPDARAAIGATGDPAPVPTIRGEGGQTYLPTMQPGIVNRIRARLANWGGRVNTLRYAGMLSDSAGHAFNAASNLVLQAADVATGPIAAGIDAGRSIATGRPREVFLREMGPRLGGMWAGARAGLQDAVEIMRTGVKPDEVTKLEQQGGRGFGTDIPGIAPAGSAAANAVNTVVEAPLRALAAADAVFRGAATGGHSAAEAYAAARKANGGRPPSPEQIAAAMFDPKVRARIDELSARSVLQEDRRLTSWWRDHVMKHAPAEVRAIAGVEMPFVRTPYNVVAQGVGVTPAGLLGLIEDVAKGKAPREMEQRVARVALGTAVMAWAASDYAEGNLTGPFPTDPAESSTLPPGWRPWSRKVEFGGETYYVPLVVLGPFAIPAVAAILGGESIKRGKDALSPEWAGAVALGLGRYAEQNTFFEGFGAISRAFDERTGEANMGKHLEQIVSQYSPHVVGGGALGREIQRIVGMPARDPEGALEALMATHPLAAGQVRPRQDILGREQSMGVSGPAAAVVRAGVEDDAGVIRAFRGAREGISRPPKSIKDPASGVTRGLDVDQRARWQRIFGRELRIGWTNAGNPRDADSLKKIEAAARTAADDTVLGRR